MSKARPNTPISLKLRPDLAARAQPAARRLGLTFSALVSILAWNDHLRPDPSLQRILDNPRLSRVGISCTLRPPIRRQAQASARSRNLSLNAYLEALVEAYLRRRRGAVTILAAPESP